MVTDSSTETDGSRIRPLYLCARIALIAFKSGNITEVCHGKQKAVLTVVIIAVIAIVAAGIAIGIVLSFQKKPDKKPSMPTETDDGIYTVINAEDDGGSEEEWEEFSGKPSNVDVYYYSEGEPTGGGKYWHYDENFLPVTWN